MAKNGKAVMAAGQSHRISLAKEKIENGWLLRQTKSGPGPDDYEEKCFYHPTEPDFSTMAMGTQEKK